MSPDADFASRAMMRALALGLAEQGIQSQTVESGHARAQLDDKRALLAAAAAQAGPRALLRAGRAVQRFGDDPVLRALVSGGNAWSLFDRWGRLERYAHSSHRTRRTPVSCSRPGRMAVAIEHYALAGQPPPHPYESLAVLGVIAGLLMMVGGLEIDVDVDGVRLIPDADDVLLAQLVDEDRLRFWKIEWAATEGVSRQAVAQCEMPSSADVHAVLLLVRADPMRRWRLADASGLLGVSSRSLQRRLAAEQSGFTDLVMLARQHLAADLLLGSNLPLAEIGYLCGYADQAHFCRLFERGVGLSPGRYRSNFASDSHEDHREDASR
jgi:AraC-like DNA-binding protein